MTALSVVTPISGEIVGKHLQRVRSICPLVHCMTNDVVQEITANVLLSLGASPAMIPSKEEAGEFAAIVSALLVNVGTLSPEFLQAMHIAVDSANEHHVPWVLDPVAAGLLSWRDKALSELIAKHPACVRGNASEIMALAHMGTGGKGVDATDASEAALTAAMHLAKTYETVVCVTGQTDYATDGARILSVSGGSEKATKVVGTGCSLSAMVAAFLAQTSDCLEATISACALAKSAAHYAAQNSRGPGSFKTAYLDALNFIVPKDFV